MAPPLSRRTLIGSALLAATVPGTTAAAAGRAFRTDRGGAPYRR
ncbi:hypothetical protein [Streptomyces sp. NPDC053367]